MHLDLLTKLPYVFSNCTKKQGLQNFIRVETDSKIVYKSNMNIRNCIVMKYSRDCLFHLLQCLNLCTHLLVDMY